MSTSAKREIPCTCLKLRRASQAITKVYDQYLEPSGIKISQYSILSSISYLQPVSVSDLASYLRLDRTTLVRNLKLIEQKGFISDLAKTGSRNRELTLTESGKAALRSAIPLWKDAQNYLEQYLGTEDLSALSSMLLKIEELSL